MEYKHLNERDHGLLRPEVYFRSLELEPREDYVLDISALKDGEIKLVKKTFEISTGLIQVFMEGLSNALDNVERSRKEGIDPKSITVFLDHQYIGIVNSGRSFKIYRDSSGLMSPELCFGEFRSSSNFNDDDRTTAGKFGVGITAVNLFSKRFEVNISDPDSKMYYEQVWTNNMGTKSEPNIIENKEGASYTSIQYTLDFKRFGLTGYTDEILEYYARLVLEACLTAQVPVYFNDWGQIDSLSLESYVKLLLPTSKIYTVSMNNMKICLADTPDSAIVSAFVNGQQCNKGSHINIILDSAADVVRNRFGISVNRREIRDHVSVFAVMRLVNAKYANGLTKESLASPKIHIVLPNFENHLRSWDLVDRLKAHLVSKKFKEEKSTDGKKTRFIDEDIPPGKYRDANLAGTKESSKCILCVVEGLSASAYVKVLNECPGFSRDYVGFYCLGGKPLNTVKTSDENLIQNKEYQWFKKILGLRSGMDYMDQKNLDTLRYGQVWWFSDADFDGLHIAALLDLLTFDKHPGLHEAGIIKRWESPVIRMKKGKKYLEFYRLHELDTWMKENPNENIKDWNPKYLKGLSSSTEEDIARDAEICNLVTRVADEAAADTLSLAFTPGRTDDRKQWIRDYDGPTKPAPKDSQSITEFIRDDLITYSVYSTKRALPSIQDNLKDVQRKTLYSGFERCPWGSKEFKKVLRFAADIGGDTDYPHGEQVLYPMIRNMATDFPGSGNNIPLIAKKGLFGTRDAGAKDGGQPRYICCKLNWITNILYSKEDSKLLKPRVDEGKSYEPIVYYPIIPPFFNGHRGIASGWSTFVPSYNPIDLIEATRTWLNTGEIPVLKPFYRGFTGEIEVDESGFTSRGRYVIKPNLDIVINEIPLFYWTSHFDAYIKALVLAGKAKDYKNHSKCDDICITIIGPSQEILDNPAEVLGLLRHHRTTNMVMLDLDGKPKEYKNISEILKEWLEWRIKVYYQRYDIMLSEMNLQLEELVNRSMFVEGFLENAINMFQPEQKIIDEMTSIGILEKYHSKLLDLKIRTLTVEKVNELKKDVETLKKKIEKHNTITGKDLWLEDLDKFEREYRKKYDK